MGRKGTGVELREKSIRVGFKWNGEWCRETLNIAPTPANEKKAIRLVADIRRAIANDTFSYADFFPDSPRAQSTKPEQRTFGKVCALYLQTIGQLKEATVDQYTNAINNVWKPLLGEHTPFDALTHEVLAAKIGSHGWASAKSCNNYLIPLRRLFAMVYSGPKAVHNPMNGITNRKAVKKKPDPLTEAERDRILAYMAEHYDARVWAYFTFAFFTGMRPEEIIALQWDDIDWASATIRVQRVRTFRGGERDGTKTDMERDVDLTAPALAALETMKQWTYAKTIERNGERVRADIFENPITVEPWHDERSQRDTYWKPCLRKLGIRARRAYATRHTYCTAALMARINPAYIAAQAGHSVKILLDTYARWIPGADGGSERDKLRAAHAGASNISLEFPRAVGAENGNAGKPLNINSLPASDIGRRDWTRTDSRRKK